MEKSQIERKRFFMGEELCPLDDVRMGMRLIANWKAFSYNLVLLHPLKYI